MTDQLTDDTPPVLYISADTSDLTTRYKATPRMHMCAEAWVPKETLDAVLKDVDFLRTTIRSNIVVKPGPHTVELPDGSIHSGPLADFMHDLLPMIADVLDRAALAALPGADEGEQDEGDG